MLPPRGEVWLFDLGMTAKTRPVVIVNVPYGDDDRALVTVVPHTTEPRGSPFEIPVQAQFLRPGAFLVQGISTYPKAWAIRKLGMLKPAQLDDVMDGVADWLGLRVRPATTRRDTGGRLTTGSAVAGRCGGITAAGVGRRKARAAQIHRPIHVKNPKIPAISPHGSTAPGNRVFSQ
jgi:mRNA interferase MazF